MRYILTSEFTPIDATTGTIVNIGGVAVEISDEPTNRTGILLYPRHKLTFSDATLYAKQAAGYYGTATIAVLPVAHCSGGGSGGGSGTGIKIDIATDEEFAAMLDAVLPAPSETEPATTASATQGGDGYEVATDEEFAAMLDAVLPTP